MGLFDQLSNLSPSQSSGLLAAAAQLLQAGGPSRTPTSLGQAFGGGLQAYQQGVESADRRGQEAEQARQLAALRALQIQSAERSAQSQLQGDQQQQAIQAAAQSSVVDGQFDQDAFLSRLRGIDALKAMDFEKQFAKQGPKFDTKPQTAIGPDGKPFQYIVAENGEIKRIDGVLPRDETKWLNLNNRMVAASQYAQPGESLTLGVSPDTQANNAVAVRGQNMTDARQRDANQMKLAETGMLKEQKVRDENLAKSGQIASFDTMLGTLDRLKAHPGLSRSVGLYSKVPTVPGTDSANFQAELETFKSQAFIPAVAQLKGMGALSDAEGKKLSAAVGALDPRMSEGEFKKSIDRIVGEMSAARSRVVNSSRSTVQQNMGGQRMPEVGEVDGGYRFKGGNPADPSSWEKQ